MTCRRSFYPIAHMSVCFMSLHVCNYSWNRVSPVKFKILGCNLYCWYFSLKIEYQAPEFLGWTCFPVMLLLHSSSLFKMFRGDVVLGVQMYICYSLEVDRLTLLASVVLHTMKFKSKVGEILPLKLLVHYLQI